MDDEDDTDDTTTVGGEQEIGGYRMMGTENDGRDAAQRQQ